MFGAKLLEYDPLLETQATDGGREASDLAVQRETRAFSQSLLQRELSNLATFGTVLTGTASHSAKSNMNGTWVEVIAPNRIYFSDVWPAAKAIPIDVGNETWTVPCFGFYDSELLDYLERDRRSTGISQVQHPFWTQLESKYRRFRRRLIGLLCEEPIEEGVSHPADQLIKESLDADQVTCRDWLSRSLAENLYLRTSIAASILRCIGRLSSGQVGTWGIDVVEKAICSDDAEVRDAAIRALEKWGTDECLLVLRQHRDPEGWLDDYVQQVICDLESGED